MSLNKTIKIKSCKDCKYFKREKINLAGERYLYIEYRCHCPNFAKEENTLNFIEGYENTFDIYSLCNDARKNKEMCEIEGINFEKKKVTSKQRYSGMLIIGVIFFAFLFSLLPQANAAVPSSFGEAKKMMYQVYFDNRKTFYCGCDYLNRQVDLNSCGYEVRKNKRRASRTEAEHIVQAYYLAMLTPEGRQCWKEGTKRKGTNGRKYCLKNNKQFKQAHNDLMNLVPVIGEVNGDRSNYSFAMIPGEVREHGACDFEIDNSGATTKRILKAVEPAPNIRGDIARTYFYMADKYGLQLSRQTKQLMQAWSKQDSVNGWEQERIKRIQSIQGE